MIYKSQFTGAEIDDGINKARQALTATGQNSERIDILEFDNESIKTQVGALSVRVDNVENTASTAKTTADSALSTAQSASSTANNALTATNQNSERIQLLETDNENIKTQVGALDVRLDNVEIKVNKALVKPDSAPSSTSLVAVDNSNAQTMLAVGDGLSVENGTLKATSGGGTSIGGGFEIFSTWQGNMSSSKFLILGKRAKDGVYGLHNKYDDLYNGKVDPNSVAYTNVSIVIPLSWDKDYFYVRDYSALRAYDGTVLTATNKDNYINKICYLVKNADFIEYE